MQLPRQQVVALLSLREGVGQQQTEPPGVAFTVDTLVFAEHLAKVMQNFSVEAHKASQAFKGLEMAITTGFGDAVKRSIGDQ